MYFHCPEREACVLNKTYLACRFNLTIFPADFCCMEGKKQHLSVHRSTLFFVYRLGAWHMHAVGYIAGYKATGWKLNPPLWISKKIISLIYQVYIVSLNACM